MEVEIKNVINELSKKSDGSMTFAVAIACLEEADKQSEVIEIIKNFNAYTVYEIQGQWYLFIGAPMVRNTIRKPITKETAKLIREILCVKN